MSGPGIGQDRDVGLGQADGKRDLAHTRCAQLNDRGFEFRRQFQQRQRDAQFVVQVPPRCQHRTTGAQDARKHFLHGGLAAGTGDRSDRLVYKGIAVQRAELREGFAGVGDDQLRQRTARDLALDQRADRPCGGYLIEVVVPIKTRAGQRHEQLAGRDRTAVDTDTGKTAVMAHTTRVERHEQFAERERLKHVRPPRRRALWWLLQDRKTADVLR